MVIELKPEHLEEYKRVHSSEHAGVRDLLALYHLRNFNIFLHQLDGKWMEFAYYEYHGEDFEGDMKALDAEVRGEGGVLRGQPGAPPCLTPAHPPQPRNIEWHKICDPMQVPSAHSLDGVGAWQIMDQVYLNE